MIEINSLVEDSNFSGIIVLLDSNLSILNANKVFMDLLDYTIEDIYNKPFIDLIVPDEKTLFNDLNFVQSISNKITIKLYHKSGAYRFFPITMLDFDNQKIIFGSTLKKEYFSEKYEYLTDVTSNIGELFKNIEFDNIRDFITFSDNRMSLMLDLLPIEVWVKDKYGKYIFVNQAFTSANGKTNSDVFLKDDYQIFDNATANEFVTSDSVAVDSRKKISYNFKLNFNNTVSWAEVTKIPIYNKLNEYIGLLGFSINITHSKKIEEDSSKEALRNKYILEHFDIMMFEMEPNGNLVFVSENMKDLLDISSLKGSEGNLISLNENTPELNEKLKLVLNGTQMDFQIKIKETEILFNLHPLLRENGEYNVIGFGKEVLSSSDKHG